MSQAVERITENDADNRVVSQFVTFHVNEEAFGVPMEKVIEIIRVPATVQVPLTPRSLVGLANLRGRVLPVLDLRRVLALPEVEYSDSTRVIVVDSGMPLGVVVDRVARVLDVDASAIESTDRVKSTINSDFLDGVAKNVDGHDLVQLLDVHKAVEQEFAQVMAAIQQRSAEAAGQGVSVEDDSLDDEEDDTRQLVSFLVDGQEYAFDICEVEEIVRVPEHISAVPRTEGHVLGLINLRGQLLPLVGLRALFEMEPAPTNEQNRVLVVSLQEEGLPDESVGIVVDQVREVLGVPQELLDRMPGLLRQSRDLDEIGAVCRLEDGKRLVSVLSSGALFQHPSIQEAVAARNAELVEQNMEHVSQDRAAVSEESEDQETQLVVFQLNGQEFSVAIDRVQEITRVPDEMTTVPKTPEFIEGIVNLRGSVLPVLDMRTRFGLPRMERNERQRILVLDLDGMRTGFITDAVLEVLRLSRSLIEKAPPLSSEQSRMMGNVVNFRDKGRMIQILEVDELLDRSELAALNDAI